MNFKVMWIENLLFYRIYTECNAIAFLHFLYGIEIDVKKLYNTQ
jgi:hypothetical protein